MSQLRCERCKRFLGEDCLEGIDWDAGMQMDGDVFWTDTYYCAAGVGCNSDVPVAALDTPAGAAARARAFEGALDIVRQWGSP